MNRRPTTASSASCVNKYIGTAYDEMKELYDNLDTLLELAGISGELLHYLGVYTATPTNRPDGTAIQNGDYYIDSGTNEILYWDEVDAEWLAFSANFAEVTRLAAEAAASALAAETSATNAATSENLAEKWASNPEGSEVVTGEYSAYHWAKEAEAKVGSTFQSGGVWKPTAANEYPTAPTIDTLWIIGFDTLGDTYTFTTGTLAGEDAHNTDILMYDVGGGGWILIPSSTANAVLSVNGKTGSAIDLTSVDIPHTETSGTITDVRTALRNHDTAIGDVDARVTQTEADNAAQDTRLDNIEAGTTPLDADTVDGLHDTDLVQIAADQIVTGTKTFTGSVNVATPVDNTNATTKLYTDTADNALDVRLTQAELDIDNIEGGITTVPKATDADTVDNLHGVDLVQVAGTQTVTGSKTFTISPLVPNPTNALHATSKGYVDTADATLTARIRAVEDTDITLTLDGDATGIATFTALSDATLTVTVEDDSHDHIIANVDGLQTELDAKLDDSREVNTLVGSGLQGGGDLTVDRNLSVDIGGLAPITTPALTDEFMIQTAAGLRRVAMNSISTGGTTLLYRGSVTMLAGADSATAHDDTLGNVAIDATTFPTGASTGWSYIVDNTAVGNTITGTAEDYTPGAVLVYSGSGWIKLDQGVQSFNGREGAVVPLATDYSAFYPEIGSVEADTLDGQHGAFYQDASNINAGTIDDARLPDDITSNISGNAATADTWSTARNLALVGDVTGTVSIDGSGDVTLTATVVDDSHNHIIANVDGLQTTLDGMNTQITANQVGIGNIVLGTTVVAEADTVDGLHGADLVTITNTQTIVGRKTFTQEVSVPTPVTNADATNKGYVDHIAVPTGGAANQVLSKASSTDHDLTWVDMAGVVNPNLFINGNESVNQREVVDWASVTIGEYGFDRWKKIDASTKRQPVEDGTYLPNTTYTISAVGVAPRTITSPLSGHWDNTDLDVPITATNMKLELGDGASLYVPDAPATNLAKCQRYYVYMEGTVWHGCAVSASTTANRVVTIPFPVTMRANPSSVTYGTSGGWGAVVIDRLRKDACRAIGLPDDINDGSFITDIRANAEI